HRQARLRPGGARRGTAPAPAEPGSPPVSPRSPVRLLVRGLGGRGIGRGADVVAERRRKDGHLGVVRPGPAPGAPAGQRGQRRQRGDRAMRLKLRGSLARVTIKVAVFAAICVVLLAILAKEVGNLSFFTHRVSYKADMPDVTGLFPTDDVKVAGVKVGQVAKVTTDHGHAVVTFNVDKTVPLRSSTQVGLRYRNVLGEKYLYLYPGSTGRVMSSGSTIPMNQAVSDADIDAFLNALGPFVKAINPQEGNLFVQAMVSALEGNQNQVTQLLGNTATVSSTLGNLNQQVGGVIDT